MVVDQIDLTTLFQEKNKHDLVAIEIYYNIYNKYCEKHFICFTYLAKLNKQIGYVMLINYYVYKNNTDKAIELCLYYANKRENPYKSWYFCHAVEIYFDKQQYRNANKMLNNAIRLHKCCDYFYILKIRACLTLTHWPIALYAFFTMLRLPTIRVVVDNEEETALQCADDNYAEETTEIEGEDEYECEYMK